MIRPDDNIEATIDVTEFTLLDIPKLAKDDGISPTIRWICDFHKVKPCTDCNAKGRIEFLDHNADTKGFIECKTCHGNGYIFNKETRSVR